jgi:DNA invertase Pin-like site-specific DNA recombinase
MGISDLNALKIPLNPLVALTYCGVVKATPQTGTENSRLTRIKVVNVYGVLRVSTTEQAANGASLDVQRRQIEGYALMQGWTVADWFVDDGVSGSIPLAKRPQGSRLLALVRPGDVIVASKLDRVFRDALDALESLEWLKARKIGLHLLDLGGDVTGNGLSKVVFTVIAAFAEHERDRIRQRITEGKREKAAQGHYGGGKRPFGFDVVDNRLVPNASEQAALARMQAMRAEGTTYRAIAAAEGFDDPKTVKRMLDRVIRMKTAA